VGKGCLGCFGLVIVLVVIGSLAGGDEEPGAQPVDAWVACQHFIEQRLTSPSSAKYPGRYTDYVSELGDGRFRVRAYVDAQNSFGAVVRNQFDCTVEHNGSGFRLEALRLY
jgi:hypothetical protein